MIAVSWFAVSSKAVNGDELSSFLDSPLVFDGKIVVDCDKVVILEWDNLIDWPNFDIEWYLSPIQDWWWVYRHNATTRTIEFTLLIRGDTVIEYEQKVSEIKEILTTTQRYLEFTNEGIRKRIKCSLDSFTEEGSSKDKNKLWEFRVIMEAYWDVESLESFWAVFENISSDTSIFVINPGTKLAYPNIYVTFWAWSSCTEVSFGYWDYTYTVFWSFSWWDTIIWYWVNPNPRNELRFFEWTNVLVSSWPYPTIGKFWQSINVSFVWTPVDVSIWFSYNKKYY